MTVVAVAGGPRGFRAAVEAGAEAVRLALPSPSSALALPSRDELAGLFGLARARGCRAWASLDWQVGERHLPDVVRLFDRLARAGAEAIEVGDLGVLALARDHAPALAIHASARLGGRSAAAVEALVEAGVVRVVLPGEVTREEVAAIARRVTVELEVLVHGPTCFALAGRCYLARLTGGRGHNRGPCPEPCRRLLAVGDRRGALLSAADRTAWVHVPELAAAGVAAFRVEAPERSPGSLAALVTAYRRAAGAGPLLSDEDRHAIRAALADVFERRTTSGFLGTEAPGDVLDLDDNHFGQLVGLVEPHDDAMPPLIAGRFRTVARVALRRGDRLRLGPDDDKSFVLEGLHRDGASVAECPAGVAVELETPLPAAPGARVWRTGTCEPELAALLPDPSGGLPLRLGVTVESEGLVVTVSDRKGVLAASRWPLVPSASAPEDLEAALAPPPGSGLRIDTFAVRGSPVGGVEGLPSRVVALWAEVDATLAARLAALVAALAPVPDRSRDATRPRTAIAVPGLDAALHVLGAAARSGPGEAGVEVARVVLPLSALDAPDVDLGALPPSARARFVLSLPLASFEGDTSELARRVRRLADGGFAGVEVHDIGQVRTLRGLGVPLVAGAGLPATNAPAIALLQALGCAAATASPDDEPDDWLALLAARPSLPLRVRIHGWPIVAVTRLRVPHAGGVLVDDAGRRLRAHVEGPLTVLVAEEPVSFFEARGVLGAAGAAELVFDGARAPRGGDRGGPGALVREAGGRGGSGVGVAASPPDPAATTALLRRLYAATDRVTGGFRTRLGLECPPGCGRCCAQFVPVWPVEAAVLAPAVRALVSDAEAHRTLLARARARLAEEARRLAAAGVRRQPGALVTWGAREGQLDTLAGSESSPCVLLEDGRCRVYADRTLLCRLFGFPTTAIPGNLCRRLTGPLLARAAGRTLPSIPADHVRKLADAIRRLQGQRPGITEVTTIAGIVVHALDPA